MGNLFDNNQNVQKSNLLMTGLDNAGKTTILYILKSDKVETFIPSIGFNVEKLQLKQFQIFAWDIGGSDPRVLVYNPDDLTYNGIIYVVDCSDKERIIYAIDELQKLLSIEKLKDLPILLLANKKDLVQVNLQEIACEFKLEKLSKNWHIQPCHAITGEGIQDGLKWMQQQLK